MSLRFRIYNLKGQYSLCFGIILCVVEHVLNTSLLNCLPYNLSDK